MKTQPTFLTKEGYEELKQELSRLETVRRREVAHRLHLALDDGDILENAELEAARNEQSFVEGRILDIRSVLGAATIIEDTGPHDTARVGTHIEVVDLGGDGATETYHIVGSAEADPMNGSISNESPLGRELMGRKVGEEAVVYAPGGKIVFKIVGVR